MTPPLIWPRTGTDVRILHTAVEKVAGELTGMTGAGDATLPTYLEWAMQSISRLQAHLASEDLDRLIRTPTFWTSLGLPTHNPQAQYLINVEKENRRDYLTKVVASLAAFRTRFQNVPETAMVLVLDTSMVVRYGDGFSKADWRGLLPRLAEEHAADGLSGYDTLHLVLPLLVIDELDGLKDRGKDPARSRARNVLKLVHSKLSDNPNGRHTIQEAAGGVRPVTLEILMESPEHRRLPRPDDEIVAVAARLRNALGSRVAVASTDTGFDLRASAQDMRHVLVSFD